MNGVDYKSYFMQPVETAQRRYEALRCVFVEEQTMKQVAQRFELSYEISQIGHGGDSRVSSLSGSFRPPPRHRQTHRFSMVIWIASDV